MTQLTNQTDGQTNGIAAGISRPLPQGITPEDLVDYYRRMITIRTIDERIWMMNRQGKVPIAASGQGHEAAQLGALLAAEKDGKLLPLPLLPRPVHQDGRRPDSHPGDAFLHGQGG